MTAIAQDFSMKCVDTAPDNRQVENTVQATVITGDQRLTHETCNLDQVVPSNGHKVQKWTAAAGATSSNGNAAAGDVAVDEKDVQFADEETQTVVDRNHPALSSGNIDGATVSNRRGSRMEENCDTISGEVKDCDYHDKTYATMQGFFSGLFEGLGLGLGAFVAGLLIDKMGSTIAWRFAGYLSLFVCIGNVLVNLNLEKCSN